MRVAHLQFIFLLVFNLFFLTYAAFSQILESPPQNQDQDIDTSSIEIKEYTGKGSILLNEEAQNPYGPTTTLWISEEKIIQNQMDYKTLDTSIVNYHRWTVTRRFNYHYQDLGNMGTALNSIFPQVPTRIGANSGFTSYTTYFNLDSQKYMNTKSPFSSIRIVWGGKGRAYSHIRYSRNINPRWNFGFSYRPILVDKQIQRQRKGDRQTISHYYSLYSSYFSKNDRYSLLFNARRMRHRVHENGGLIIDSEEPFSSYFSPTARAFLSATNTENYNVSFHLWHQYKVGKNLQWYQSFDIDRQDNLFRRDRSAESNYDDFYPQTIITPGLDSVVVTDQNSFRSFQHTLGLKGVYKSSLLYNVFYKTRNFNNYNPLLTPFTLQAPRKGVEHYAGIQTQFHIDSLLTLCEKVEYLVGGRYKVDTRLTSPWGEARFLHTRAHPGLMGQQYKGSHDLWMQSFSNTVSNVVELHFTQRVFPFSIRPGVRYFHFLNRVFYGLSSSDNPSYRKLVRAFQSDGVQQLIIPQLKGDTRVFKKFKITSEVLYTHLLQNDQQVIQAPSWFVNFQWAYEYPMFKKAIFVHAGIDVHWQSAYYALSYSPSIQQYYIQRSFKNPAFTMVDLFFNGQFRRGRFFIVAHNILQFPTTQISQYMPTPYYRGVPFIVDFGFDLILFD